MALNDILSSALSGLGAAQAGLKTISNKIANVNTPGYVREETSLSTSVTAGTITGVTVGNPQRVASQFLQSTVYARQGGLGGAQVTADYLGQLDGLLGTPGSSQALTTQFDAVNSAAIALTTAAPGSASSSAFVGTVQDAIGALQHLGTSVAGLQASVDGQLGGTVAQVNDLLMQISSLNGLVASQHAAGQSGAGALDQRDAAIQTLSGLIAIQVATQPSGAVSISSTSGTTLLDQRPRQLVYASTPDGTAQANYAPIDVRFADAAGNPGASTGETLGVAAGGQVGGLIGLRDGTLPAVQGQLGALFTSFANALNAASNQGTSVPAPNTLNGAQTALTASDRLGFSGAAVFAVTSAKGTLVAQTRIDFSALGANATIADAVDAINAGLGGAGTAKFAQGRLTISAAKAGDGVVVAQDPTTPSSRGGAGFAQVFALNDIVQSDVGTSAPPGFAASDPTDFATGQTTSIVLRQPSGKQLAAYTLTAASGETFGDVVTKLNQSALGKYGSFALDAGGWIAFQPDANSAGATIVIPSDSTGRGDTGQSLSAITQLSGTTSGLATARIRPDIAADPALLPLARLQTDAVVGSVAIGAGDSRNAAALISAMGTPTADAQIAVQQRAQQMLAGIASQTATAQTRQTTAKAQVSDATNARDSYSGVNLDDELAKMVALQNSYSAAARVMTTTTQMYDTLIAMVG
ncbi:flagellar hook-associated protein FlgK [Sphingomonas sp. PAMC 26605]|uniref:flagellar hook-associated protein FlgK n=1 Tax=Sphingomonas sp. PAMC 26605 TaxID=1112214 RepID=UPI00026CD6AB|nr:flagellar hook-associated protein FlgK [Sphingomonas sp. PAMC 26605]